MGASIEIDNLSLFTLGSDDYQLNMKGAAFVIDSSSYAVTNDEPCQVIIHPSATTHDYSSTRIWIKIHILKCKCDGECRRDWGGIQCCRILYQCLPERLPNSGHCWQLPMEQTPVYLFTTAVDGAGATVLTSTAGGNKRELTRRQCVSGEPWPRIQRGRCPYSGGWEMGLGQVNWTVGDRHPAPSPGPLTQNDALAHISIDGDQLLPGDRFQNTCTGGQ